MTDPIDNMLTLAAREIGTLVTAENQNSIDFAIHRVPVNLLKGDDWELDIVNGGKPDAFVVARKSIGKIDLTAYIEHK